MEAFCMKCKKKTTVVDPRNEIKVTTRGEKNFGVGKCPTCNTVCYRVMKKGDIAK